MHYQEFYFSKTSIFYIRLTPEYLFSFHLFLWNKFSMRGNLKRFFWEESIESKSHILIRGEERGVRRPIEFICEIEWLFWRPWDHWESTGFPQYSPRLKNLSPGIPKVVIYQQNSFKVPLFKYFPSLFEVWL